jgi:hypothetical protein
MTSKIDSHRREINFVKSILPIAKTILETGTFDPHLLKNPEVTGIGYCRGLNYGFANTNAYVLYRDDYTCQHCKGKTKDRRKEVHHIVYRSDGGSDDQSNLITLCKTCHDAVHSGEIQLNKLGKKKTTLKHATQMNSIRKQLLRTINCEETFGYITKEHRQLLNLPKTHFNDAVTIACINNIVSSGLLDIRPSNIVYLKRHVSKGDYQQRKGKHSQIVIPTGKLFGLRKYDLVRTAKGTGFIKGKRSSGFFDIMNIKGESIGHSINVKRNCQRISARKTTLMVQHKYSSI